MRSSTKCLRLSSAFPGACPLGRRDKFTFQDILRHVKPKIKDAVPLKGPATVVDRVYKFNEGKVYNGFFCEQIDYIRDFDLTSCMMRHVDTGTEFWYIDRKDTNNVFSINFRTPPEDATGAAHVLEHLALNGSQMFPNRNTFFKMLNRSVATDMNARTAPDVTFYIFSSRNEVDFRNLQRIYLDAVFKPNLLYLDFLQEAWRLEHKDLTDRDSELMIKGIVYNEMIGIYTENHLIFRKHLMGHLFPERPYKYSSGGDPLEIPKLTYDQLIDFHINYYHPSNAQIFCYGSFDPLETLALLDQKYLSKYEYKNPDYTQILPHPRWSEPRQVHIPGRLVGMGTSPEKQNQIGCSLLMCDRTDVQETFELNVLSDLLIRGPNSAFYKGLIEPNFSGGFNRNTGYYVNSRETYFAVGLHDLLVEDFSKFNELFDQTVYRAISEGFSPQHIESVLNNREISIKHQKENAGDVLLANSMAVWNHGGDIVANLQVSEMIAKLRQKLKENKSYFQQKVEQYFLNNKHKLTLTMSADPSFNEDFKKAEKELIEQKVSELGPDGVEKMYQNALKLHAIQKIEENSDALPSLTMKDVREPLHAPQLTERFIKHVPTQICVVPTNGLTYFNCIFNITGLSPEDALLVPLFCHVIKNVGTKKDNFLDFDQKLHSKTAGVEFKVNIVKNVRDSKTFQVGLLMTTYALDKNVSQMFCLCQELLQHFDLEDKERFKMLVESYVSKLPVGVAFNGHNFAMIGSGALICTAANMKSKLLGIDHIEFMKKYVKENTTEQIRQNLKKISSNIFTKKNMRVAINTSEGFESSAIKHYKAFLKKLPMGEERIMMSECSLIESNFKHYHMNLPVNYCAKTFFAAAYLHDDHPVLRVLAKLVSANYLLPVVREQNGAYGAGARVGYDGLFHFYSYRDPNSTKTMEAFDKTYEWLSALNEKLNTQMLLEAKLGVLQLLDWPTGPGEVGIDYFILRVSYEEYAKYRARVLRVTKDELRSVVEKYFKVEKKPIGKCILGPAGEETETVTT